MEITSKYMICSELKSGDRIFVRTKFVWYKPLTIISAIIRAVAGVKYNHVEIVVRNWDIPFVNGAIFNGIISRQAIDELSGKQIRVVRRKEPIVERDFCVRANSRIGTTKYDFAGLLFHQLVYQLTNMRLWIGRSEEKADNRMACYEYAAWCYKDIDWWKADPVTMINDEDYYLIFEGKVI